MPYDHISPSITLEIWEPEEEPVSSKEQISEAELPSLGQLSYVTSRYRDLQYHPRAKNPTLPTPAASPVASGRIAPPAPKAKKIAPSVPEPIAGPILPQTVPELPSPLAQEQALEEQLPSLDEALQSYQDEYESPSDEEILGEELSGILQSQGEGQWLGDTLMNLQMSKRNLVTPPDLNFLTQEGFTSNIKVVKIRLTISPDGTVSDAAVVFPGTGNPELDRRLRLAFLRVVFNDVRSFGRKEETGTIVLNFKG